MRDGSLVRDGQHTLSTVTEMTKKGPFANTVRQRQSFTVTKGLWGRRRVLLTPHHPAIFFLAEGLSAGGAGREQSPGHNFIPVPKKVGIAWHCLAFSSVCGWGVPFLGRGGGLSGGWGWWGLTPPRSFWSFYLDIVTPWTAHGHTWSQGLVRSGTTGRDGNGRAPRNALCIQPREE